MSYSINNAQYRSRNIMSRESITMNTGYVNDSYNQVIEEFISPAVGLNKTLSSYL